MKSIPNRKPAGYVRARSPFWLSIVIALPLAALLLAAVPPDPRLWVGSLSEFVRPKPDALYRYPFTRLASESAVGSAALQQEIAFYQERIVRSPSDGLDLASLASAYVGMARLTGASHWYLLAEQAARRSLSNLPFNNHGATLVLARIAEAKHDFATATRLAEQVLRAQPGNEEAQALLVTTHLATGQLDDASRIADRLANRTLSGGALTLRALVKVARGQDRAALDDFHQALAVEEAGDASGSAWLRTLLGRFYVQRGQPELAEQLYREALHILPSYPLALIQLADLETRLGHYRSAEQHYTDVLTVTRDSTAQVFDHAVLRGMARLQALQGDRAAANQLQAQAETKLRQHLSVDSFGHRRELAHLLLERGRSADVTEALSLMQAEVRLRQDAATYDTLAWALARAGRWQEAQQAMRQALRWGVRDAEMFYRAGSIERALGHRHRADTFFQWVEKTDPTFDATTRRSLGWELDVNS
jgi:tetratricopeptide (TPR) repeat protein